MFTDQSPSHLQIPTVLNPAPAIRVAMVANKLRGSRLETPCTRALFYGYGTLYLFERSELVISDRPSSSSTFIKVDTSILLFSTKAETKQTAERDAVGQELHGFRDRYSTCSLYITSTSGKVALASPCWIFMGTTSRPRTLPQFIGPCGEGREH